MDRERERKIVEQGRAKGKSDDFIRHAVLRDRERRAVQPETPAQPQQSVGKKALGFFQDTANETAKAGVRSFLDIGNMAIKGAEAVSPVVRAVKPFFAPLKEANIFNPESKAGAQAREVAKREPGAAGMVGTGLEFLGEAAIPGVPAVRAYKAAKATKAFDAVVDAVSPRLNVREAADALAKRGAEKTGLFRTAKAVVDKTTERIAKTVQEHVPGFNPSGNLVDNINAARKAVSTQAEALKADVANVAGDAIYSFKELGSRLRSVEKPLLIASDNTLNAAYDRVVAKAMEIAQKNGGKIPSLFDTRKQFDEFVARQFPNLYSSDTLTPMRTAIMQVRREMNDFIDEALPKGTNFKQRLSIQRDLFDAIENMADKAARGSTKEIGKGMFDRWSKRHPVATGALKLGGTAVAGSQLFDWIRGR